MSIGKPLNVRAAHEFTVYGELIDQFEQLTDTAFVRGAATPWRRAEAGSTSHQDALPNGWKAYGVSRAPVLTSRSAPITMAS